MKSQNSIDGKRRLRVERMEDRLMLSATSLESAQHVIPIVSFTSAIGQYRFEVVSVENEGGFITSGLLSNATFFSADSSDVDTFGSAETSVDLGFNGLYALRHQINFDGANSLKTNQTPADHDGIQPATISVDEIGSSFEASYTVTLGSSNSGFGAEEGGTISIPNLLTGLRQERTLARAETVTPPVAQENLADARLASYPAKTSENSVTGEWARAAVFEMVGGVSEVSDANLLDAREVGSAIKSANQPSAEPISAAQSTSDDTSPRQPELFRLAPAVRSVGGEAQPTSYEVDVSGNERLTNVALFNAAFWMNRSFDNLNPAANTGRQSVLSPGEYEVDEFAIVSGAFDDLQRVAPAIIEPATGRNVVGRAVYAAPLLLMLALEKISSLRARDKIRLSMAEPERKPLRPIRSKCREHKPR